MCNAEMTLNFIIFFLRKGSGQAADVSITITACTMCGKKFANQPSPSGSTSSTSFLCRVCRQGHTPSSEATPFQGQAATSLNLSAAGKEKGKVGKFHCSEVLFVPELTCKKYCLLLPL